MLIYDQRPQEILNDHFNDKNISAKNLCKTKNNGIFLKNAKNEIFYLINWQADFLTSKILSKKKYNFFKIYFSYFIYSIKRFIWKITKKKLKKWVFSTNTPKNRKKVTPNLNSWSNQLLLHRNMTSFDMRKWYQTFFVDLFESIH